MEIPSFKKFRLNLPRPGKKTAHTLAEILVVLAVLLALFAGILIWRLASGPVDVGFAKNYIEQALRDEERGIYATMDTVVLHWPDLKGPLLLGVRGAKVINDQGEIIVSVDEAAISLSKARLLVGKVAPVALILKKPALRVIRTSDNQIDIGFSAPKDEASETVTQHTDDQTALTTRILQYIAHPGVEKGESSSLATLRAFEIQEARVLVEDHAMGITWFLPRFDALFESVSQGLDSKIALTLPGGREAESYINGRVLFGWESKDAQVAVEFKNFDTRILAGKIPALADFQDQDVVVDAMVEAVLDPNLNPREGRIALSSQAGSLMIPELSPEPVPFTDLAFRASYNGSENTLAVEEAKITAKDVTIKGEAALSHKEDYSYAQGDVKVSIDEVKQEQIDPLWPEVLREDNSYIWVVENLADGIFRDASATMTVKALKTENGWDFGAEQIKAAFAFDGMSVNYRAPLTKVTQGKGSGTYDDETETLAITIESAAIGDLNVAGADLKFVDIVKVGAGVADVKVKLDGPLKAALDYVAKEPIEVKPDFDTANARGAVDLDVHITFPTVNDIKMEDVDVTVDGTMSDVTLPGVVKGLDLTEGPLTVAVKGNDFSVKGKGKLSGRPITVDYKEFLNARGKPYTSKVTAGLVVDPNLRAHFGIDLSEFLEGSSYVSLTYTNLGGGKAEADIAANLKQSRLYFDPFDYEKPPGEEAEARLKAHLQDDILKEITDLTATGPGFTLDSAHLLFRQNGELTELAQGKTGRFVIDETVAALDFEFVPNGALKIVLEGPFLDLRPFLDNEDEKDEIYDDPPMLVSVAVDRMRTADGETVQYGKIYADIDSEGRFNQLELDAIAGEGDIYLRYKPDATGKRVFRFEADDAGAALKAFEIYDKIRGGTMIIYGEPIRGVNDRNLLGVAEINNFKVVEAPTFARLLGILSLGGLNELLSGEGISFNKLEANFDWLYRPKGSLLVLKDGRTSGSSVGLTFDGTFDQGAGTMDVAGTIIPMSGVNEFLSSIPLLGDILTGGSGLIAATYTAKTKTKGEEPEVFVNPLSVLTPGILRRILFE